MNLHQHQQSKPSGTVIVFIHGLNGKAYSTWDKFPEILFNEDGGAPDIAMFDYFSGKRRRFKVKPRTPDIAKTLARCIVELQRNYDQIFLVGHSMGGLIAKDSARYYLDHYERNPSPLKRLAGIFLFGTPLTGSKWALPFLSPIVLEAKYLRKNAPYQHEITEFFRLHVDSTDQPKIGNSHYDLPIYAGYSEQDKWVAAESATDSVVEKQKQPFPRAGHRNLVKPTLELHPQVNWVREKIDSISRNRSKIRGQINAEQYPLKVKQNARRRNSRLLVTDIVTSAPDASEWKDIYRQVIAGSSTASIMVADSKQARMEPDLLLSIHDSKFIVEEHPKTADYLRSAKQIFDDGKTDVRIVCVGSKTEVSMDRIHERAEPSDPQSEPPWLFTDAVEDSGQLRNLLGRYLTFMTFIKERGLRWDEYRATGGRSDVSLQRTTDEIGGH